MTMRVGIGFDVHRFSDDPECPLILAGILLPGEPGLVAHSDGDLVAHACTDAILGASGLGDIGTFFPDTDAALQGANSMDLLSQSVEQIKQAGFAVANVDCVIVTERPKINPHREQMQAQLSKALAAPATVKASRAEGLGAIGRVEGMACWATALLTAAKQS